MKFTINIECSPEEAREFMGIPDPAKVQDMMFKAMQDQIPGMPDGWADSMKQWQELQQMFFNQMMTPAGTSNASASKPKGK